MDKAHIPGWLGTNVYCVLILLYIYFSAKKVKFSASKDLKAYSYVVFVVLFSLVADTVSRLYAYENMRISLHPLILISTYAKYILLPLAMPMFYRYFMFQVKGGASRRSKILYVLLWISQIVYTITILSTFFTKAIFYYDDSGFYHRGQYYALSISLMVIMCIAIEISIIYNRNKLTRKNYTIFSLFLLVPIFGTLLQTLIYGLAFTQMATSFSVLIVFINIIVKDINKDHLTSLNDRKVFDLYLDEFILDQSTQPFSAIMVDVDDFKKINDKFGHSVGDEALIDTAQILSRSVRLNDIVCRYGGDEFLILLKNCGPESLNRLMDRIRSEVNSFNEESGRDYVISLSLGGAVYRGEEFIHKESFLAEIDKKMYIDKKKNKSKKTELQSQMQN